MKPRANSFCAPRFIDAIGLGLAISLACLREVVNARLKRKSPTEMLQKRFLHGYTLLEFERDTIAASSPASRRHPWRSRARERASTNVIKRNGPVIREKRDFHHTNGGKIVNGNIIARNDNGIINFVFGQRVA